MDFNENESLQRLTDIRVFIEILIISHLISDRLQAESLTYMVTAT